MLLKIVMGVIVVAFFGALLSGLFMLYEPKKEKQKDKQRGGKSYNKGIWVITFLFALSLVGLYLVLKYY